MQPRRDAAQLADAVGGEGQRRAVARELERQFPGAAGLPQLDADFGLSNYHQPYNNTTSFVWALPFGRGKRWASNASPLVDALVGGWELAGINTRLRRRAGDLHLHARRDVRRLGHRAGLPRRQQLPAERDLRSDGHRRRAHHHQLVQPRLRVGADRSEPALRQRGAQLRPRAEVLAARLRACRSGCRSADRRSSSSASKRSTCSTTRTSARRTATAAPARSARSRRPTIRDSCSSGSRCCGSACVRPAAGAGAAARRRQKRR